ncbi:MAG: hypothetical protein KU29_04535 [Sulfurovum sp. FS06-10]|nr:MAG: hypothetical protein KU29_04535 [Sulfurovum sp. FS06-10]
MLSTIKRLTTHFNERMIQRFSQEELPLLEKTIEKAIAKAVPGEKLKYTHPLYGITVVIQKLGLNGGELITCWKGSANV